MLPGGCVSNQIDSLNVRKCCVPGSDSLLDNDLEFAVAQDDGIVAWEFFDRQLFPPDFRNRKNSCGSIPNVRLPGAFMMDDDATDDVFLTRKQLRGILATSVGVALAS